MPSTVFKLDIVTPERKFFSDDVEMVVFKTPSGEMGVLAGHTRMVAAVAVGPLKLKQNGQWREAVMTEGFIEIQADKVVILVDTAEWPEEIDINRAKAAKERAEERLHQHLSKVEYMHSQAALTRAMARLRVTGQP
jgi:F-type H+-transporting ATPase subunit epsilon